ncbi:STAS domain-containing protein [Streptomyces sp. NPDC002886]|uniref:STAS domain-containing protein n=1 Tax=Streptomyces sp. NPDC002886 TaxID=3364667 RepID=UPI00367A197D
MRWREPHGRPSAPERHRPHPPRRHPDHLSGDMDLGHVAALRAVLSAACTGAPARVVVDLAGLAFCDSTGLNALLQGRLMCVESGRALALANPAPQMSRLLNITGADTVFDITELEADGPDRPAPML